VVVEKFHRTDVLWFCSSPEEFPCAPAAAAAAAVDDDDASFDSSSLDKKLGPDDRNFTDCITGWTKPAVPDDDDFGGTETDLELVLVSRRDRDGLRFRELDGLRRLDFLSSFSPL